MNCITAMFHFINNFILIRIISLQKILKSIDMYMISAFCTAKFIIGLIRYFNYFV